MVGQQQFEATIGQRRADDEIGQLGKPQPGDDGAAHDRAIVGAQPLISTAAINRLQPARWR